MQGGNWHPVCCVVNVTGHAHVRQSLDAGRLGCGAALGSSAAAAAAARHRALVVHDKTTSVGGDIVMLRRSALVPATRPQRY